MDPLIELPEASKARIRAREAEAQEQLNNVRRACEQDVANARRQWGDYFDLHQDQLRDAIEQARVCMDEGTLISAQYVFLAHATEYRSVLRDSSDLKTVLEKLREQVIRLYGEHTRPSIQRIETQQLEKASIEWEPERQVAHDYTPPALVGDAHFWRARRNDFREYKADEASSLSAHWDSMTDSWILRGSVEALTDFKPLATIAAKGLQSYNHTEPWRSWLDELRRRGHNYSETTTKAAYSQRAMEDPAKFAVEPPKIKGELLTGHLDQNELAVLFGPDVAEHSDAKFVQVRFEGVHGIIRRLFETSANLCLEFEARTTELPAEPAMSERNAEVSNLKAPGAAGNATHDEAPPVSSQHQVDSAPSSEPRTESPEEASETLALAHFSRRNPPAPERGQSFTIGELMSRIGQSPTAEDFEMFKAALSAQSEADKNFYRPTLTKLLRLAGKMESVEEFKTLIPPLLKELGLEIPDGVLQPPRGMPGRPFSLTSQQIYSEWAKMERANITAADCDRLAERFFADELKGVTRGSPQYRKARERIRRTLVRVKRRAAT